MSTPRELIEAELKRVVVPWLRQLGYKGSFPHFRRATDGEIDLATFQFDRSGGGFVIEISSSPEDGIVTHWGKHIPPSKVTAWVRHPDDRKRIKPALGSGTDSWFRFDDGQFEKCAQQALTELRKVGAITIR